MKNIHWQDNSKSDYLEFPGDVQDDFGWNLHRLQTSQIPGDWKPLNNVGKGIHGVYELRSFSNSGTYRVAYLTKIADVVVVLHCWQKKTQKTQKSDLALTATRYRRAMEELS